MIINAQKVENYKLNPNPDDYDVSPKLLRERLSLHPDVKVYQTGVEHMFEDVIRNGLTQVYDSAAMQIRTFPDFILIENENTSFVEAKCRTTSVEAVGLYFNKMRERMGAKVIYSFPLVNITASLIPMGVIQIPLKYRQKFDRFLKPLFEEEGCSFNYWSNNPKNGSGDPFVRIDEDDLKILSEGDF